MNTLHMPVYHVVLDMRCENQTNMVLISFDKVSQHMGN